MALFLTVFFQYAVEPKSSNEIVNSFLSQVVGERALNTVNRFSVNLLAHISSHSYIPNTLYGLFNVRARFRQIK